MTHVGFDLYNTHPYTYIYWTILLFLMHKGTAIQCLKSNSQTNHTYDLIIGVNVCAEPATNF